MNKLSYQFNNYNRIMINKYNKGNSNILMIYNLQNNYNNNLMKLID